MITYYKLFFNMNAFCHLFGGVLKCMELCIIYIYVLVLQYF